ncbi:MAG TPA: SDR family oxidoreductase [Myxococcaceae bacterium]|nr:SDR family oxidoreductase [Myxococcaceae bacterium]
MKRLAGKVALVLGGSRGIGAAIARRLASDGANVAFTFRRASEEALRVAREMEASGGRTLALYLEAADAEAVTRAVTSTVEALGRLDILVNNAGVFPSGPIEGVTDEEIEQAIALHVRAPFVAARAAVPHMAAGGRVISIGSSLADRVPYGGVTLYAMTKAALNGLTRALARELGPRGITVNVVHPGSTDTAMNPADGPGADAERALMALGRYGEPTDVAAMVGFLASDDGRMVTGAQLAVDGGANA